MAKQIQMTKGDDVIKCSEDHIEHFESLGYKAEKNSLKKAQKVLKEEEAEKE